MGLGRQGDQQGTMYLAWDEIPRSRGHAFYDRLQQILRKAGVDAFAEKLCKPFYSDKGRPKGRGRQACRFGVCLKLTSGVIFELRQNRIFFLFLDCCSQGL